MLLRPDGDAVICIGQPAHAFVSGQLAAGWQPRPEPFEEVVLAATQHDAGMADWDAAPELNPDTGLPQSFMEMELGTHLRLWSHAGCVTQRRAKGEGVARSARPVNGDARDGGGDVRAPRVRRLQVRRSTAAQRHHVHRPATHRYFSWRHWRFRHRH